MLNPSETKTPMSIIKDLLKSGIVIQLSWFAIMVLVDISTVLFALVSSFPSQVIGSDAVFSQALNIINSLLNQDFFLFLVLFVFELYFLYTAFVIFVHYIDLFL